MSKVEVMTSFDRWILKVVSGVVIAGILAGSGLMVGLREDLAVLKTEVAALSRAVDKGTNKRYDSDMATADKQLLNSRIEQVEHRLMRLEARIDKLEKE